MAVALEGIDLVALCAVLLLIGLLIAVRNTFSQLASVLDVDIFGVRPFHGVSSAIESTIIAGCNSGISGLEHVAVTLFHWGAEALKLTFEGLDSFVTHAAHSLHWLYDTGIALAVHDVTDPIERHLHTVDLVAHDAANAVKTEALDRERAITHAVDGLTSYVTTHLHDLRSAVEADTLRELPNVDADVRALVAAAVTRIEHATDLTASTLAGAAEQAVQNATTAEGALAEEIRTLLGKLNPADVAALIAAIPLLKAAVDTLEAETGLGNAECRQKVKGICGTDPSRWLHFLEGLAFSFAWPGLEAFAEDVADGVGEVVDAIEALIAA